MGNTEENRLMPEAWQDGPRYGSPSTFMQIPGSRDLSKADVAIVGLPLDLGTIIRSGARFGPRGIRTASMHVGQHGLEAAELTEPFKSLRIVDYGDIELTYGYIEEAVRRIEVAVTDIISQDVFPVCLGGRPHGVPPNPEGAVQEAREDIPRPLRCTPRLLGAAQGYAYTPWNHVPHRLG